MTHILRTQRLLLRPLVAEDAGTLTELIGDYQVSKWLTMVPYPYTRADADWFIDSDMNTPGKSWALDAGDGLMGVITLDVDLGYWLARKYWRKGFMSEAADAVVRAHFADATNDEVHSGHFVDNVGSGAILRGLGFVPTIIEDVQPKSRADTVQLQKMHLTRAAWEARDG